MSTDPYSIQTAVPIPDRETYVPEWNPGWGPKDLEAWVVTREGVPLGFQVRDILPERRWAIHKQGYTIHDRIDDRPTGELFTKEEFRRFYGQWISRACAPDGTLVNVADQNKYFDPNLEPIPSPKDFVNRKLDYQGKGVPILWEDGLAPPKPPEVETYTHEGEKAEAERETKSPVGFDAIREQKKKDDTEQAQASGLACSVCGKPAKSKAGLAAHKRHVHKEA